MGLQIDTINDLYAEADEYQKAYDKQVIDTDELATAQTRIKDEVRKELGLAPIPA